MDCSSFIFFRTLRALRATRTTKIRLRFIAFIVVVQNLYVQVRHGFDDSCVQLIKVLVVSLNGTIREFRVDYFQRFNDGLFCLSNIRTVLSQADWFMQVCVKIIMYIFFTILEFLNSKISTYQEINLFVVFICVVLFSICTCIDE